MGGASYLFENPQLFHTCGKSWLVEKEGESSISGPLRKPRDAAAFRPFGIAPLTAPFSPAFDRDTGGLYTPRFFSEG
jgi:hypothetical protein